MNRRKFIKAASVASVAGVSGCVGSPENDDSDVNQKDSDIVNGDKKNIDNELKFLESQLVSGNAGGEDSIPSIDNPKFISAMEYNVENFNDDIVFGININGEKKAYPRLILTHHEIVNDTVGGTDVSVTYCPLTGTVLAYETERVEFGVSGRLLNNNLVMFDRETGSYWPQMLGVAISGEHKGDFLKEREVVWTKWDKWVEEHPDTEVLSTETGYLRDYSRGIYGGYEPRSGYYELDQGPLFKPLETDRRLPPKKKVLGGRTKENSYAVSKELLRNERIVNFKNQIVGVYDERYDTGYMYSKSQEDNISMTESNKYKIRGKNYNPDALPLKRLSDYESMWFAWYGFFPSTEVKYE